MDGQCVAICLGAVIAVVSNSCRPIYCGVSPRTASSHPVTVLSLPFLIFFDAFPQYF